MKPGVFCLGGPNFDPKSLSPENLMRLGFTSDEANTVISASCAKRFPLDFVSGYSEQILSRKLVHGGLADANLGFAALFAVIVRYPLIPDCNRLRPDYLIIRVRSTHTANTALNSGCRALFSDLRHLHSLNYSSCGRVGMWSKMEYSGNCLLSRFRSDFNFLPFRIKLSQNKTQPALCLSYHRNENNSYVFRFETCIEEERIVHRKMNFVFKYGRQQHFHFYPMSNGRQHIKFADPENNYVQCLTYQDSHLRSLPCIAFSPNFYLQRRKARIRKAKQGSFPSHAADRVTFKLPAGPNHKMPLCLTLSWGSRKNNSSSDVELLPCLTNKRRDSVLSSRSQIFTIERTQTVGDAILRV